jgi:hypothetical protein
VEEVEKDIKIKVTNEFVPQCFGRPYYEMEVAKDVQHVDTSGLPQFKAKEEYVIRLNKSKAVYQDFAKIGRFNEKFLDS